MTVRFAVVDTNVAVVANGKSEQASQTCVQDCAVRLQELTRCGRLVLDDTRLIITGNRSRIYVRVAETGPVLG